MRCYLPEAVFRLRLGLFSRGHGWRLVNLTDMNRRIRSSAMVVAGFIWMAFSAGIGLILFQYVAGGAGLQMFDLCPVSSGTILFGMVHVVGFFAGAGLCFVIGAGLCAYGLNPAPESPAKISARSSASSPR